MNDKNNNFDFALKPGTQLNNKYMVLSFIGSGGTAITYKAKRKESGEEIAIKEFFPSGCCARGADKKVIKSKKEEEFFEENKARFEKEAKLMQDNGNNSGIMQVYEIFEQNDTVYYAMEYLDGCTLEQHLYKNGGTLSWEKTKEIMFPIFNSLISIHRFNIWHRDISPDNIFICNDGKVRIIDFGNAKEGFTGASKVLDWVKEGYSPLEQYNSAFSQGTWTDVYALAATIYRCLTGKVPLLAEARRRKDTLSSPRELGVEITPQIDAHIMKALEVLPSNRYQTLAEFKERLYSQAATVPLTQNKIESIDPSSYIPQQKMVVKLIGLEGIYTGNMISVMEPLTLGRRTDLCNLIFPIDTPGVSGLHCQIYWEEEKDGCILRDLGSTYGTRLLNGKLIERNQDYLLKEGEGFIIGDDNIFAISKEFEKI